MTDNRTTELREKLTEHGVDYEVKDLSNIKFFHDTRWNANGVHWCYTEFVGATTCLTMCNEWKDCTPEQAIAVTLGSEYHGYEQAAIEAWESIKAWNSRAELGSELPYDELLRCLENDWHIRASWDGLRKIWCIELTEEGVKLRDATHGTLTADDVLNAVYNHGARWQAIADELNAELGSGTCEIECFDNGVDERMDGELFSYAPPTWYLSCGHTAQGTEMPNFCPSCGKWVKQ